MVEWVCPLSVLSPYLLTVAQNCCKALRYYKVLGASMQRRRGRFNDKRKLRMVCEPEDLDRLSRTVRYGGNPEHKRNPGDFGLTPPSHPRADKTLCDAVSIFSKAEAQRLLRSGARKGLISVSERNGFPQNIWVVTESGCPLEAQLENPDQGVYHGYPMPETDPFRSKVIETWNNNER